jgi:hypothetical protein
MPTCFMAGYCRGGGVGSRGEGPRLMAAVVARSEVDNVDSGSQQRWRQQQLRTVVVAAVAAAVYCGDGGSGSSSGSSGGGGGGSS